MTFLIISFGVHLLGIVLILSPGKAVNGDCSSYKPLSLGNCHQLVNGTHERYHTFKCKYKKFGELSNCLFIWCQTLALCFCQTNDWITLCSKKFYWFRTSRFIISTATTKSVNASYVRNIHVKYCGRIHGGRRTVKLFAIKTSGYRCEWRNFPNANTRQIQRFGSGAIDKCDKLVNGTNGSWLKIYTIDEWCQSFATCFQFQELTKTCRTEFWFYFFHFRWENQAFTFELSYYLSRRRIQVTYTRHFQFVVNIIRCDSVAKNNGSELEPENDGSGDSSGDSSGDGSGDGSGDTDDYDLNMEINNAINRLDVQKNDSLQNAVNVFDIKIKEYANLTSFPGTSLNRTREQKMQEVFMATVIFEDFVIRFGQYHLTQKVTSIHLTSKNIDLQVRKRFYENESDFYLEEPQGQNYIRIPSGDFHHGSVLLGVVYKNLIDLFLNNKTEAINKSSKSLNTAIMSATINPPTAVALQENVTLMFSNVKQEATRNRECVFWNFLENSLVGWSGQGCHVKWMNDSKTVCSCNHLTHFAVLMQFDTNSADSAGHKNNRITEADEKILEILTYVFLTLSLIGMILTIICYVFLTDMKAPLSQIRISLVASLGAGQIIFLSGIGATENKGACVTVASLVQYFLMAAFCWMLIEGIYLYLFVVKVYNVSNKMKICHGASWGAPAVIVVLSLSIAAGMDGIESFVSEKYCWMSSSNGLIWIFVSFVIVIELVNILILVRVIKEMTAMEQTKDNHAEQIRLGIRACVVLIPLLGVTWLFGLLSSTHKAFAYIFTIFNSTQGFLIFLLHCVRNSEIRERFRRKYRLIFPAASDGTSAVKRNSKVNDSSAIISLRKIDIMPKSTESLVAISS